MRKVIELPGNMAKFWCIYWQYALVSLGTMGYPATRAYSNCDSDFLLRHRNMLSQWHLPHAWLQGELGNESYKICLGGFPLHVCMDVIYFLSWGPMISVVRLVLCLCVHQEVVKTMCKFTWLVFLFTLYVYTCGSVADCLNFWCWTFSQQLLPPFLEPSMSSLLYKYLVEAMGLWRWRLH